MDPYSPRDKTEADEFRRTWVEELLSVREGIALALDDPRFGSSRIYSMLGFQPVVTNPFDFAGLLAARARQRVDVILIDMLVGQLINSAWLLPHSLRVVDLDYMCQIGGNKKTKPLEDVQALLEKQKFADNAVLFVTYTPAHDTTHTGEQDKALDDTVHASASKGGYHAERVGNLPYHSIRLDSFGVRRPF